MSDLLSYLVLPASGDAVVQLGAARDLLAARILARKADEGHPHARAFVEAAHEKMAQANVRRLRANRLRAGAMRASRMGAHDLARMGAEAAREEEGEALALEANMISAVRGSHMTDSLGYSAFSPEESRQLQRKAFEEGLSASQREDLAGKLLTQLYQSASGDTGKGSANYGAFDDPPSSDIAPYLAASYFQMASVAFGGDLDSVLGTDAAEKAGAVLGAAISAVKQQISGLAVREARVARREERRAIRARMRELRKQLRALRMSHVAVGEAEDARVGLDASEEAYLDSALAGDDFGVDTKGAGRVALALATGGASEMVRAGAHAVGKSKVIAKMRTLPDKKLRAIAKDGLRKKDVRAAARAELARRAGGTDEDDESASSADESDYSNSVTLPSAMDEGGYLASYKGVAPGPQKIVKFFGDRAAAHSFGGVAGDDPRVLAKAVQSGDSFGGLFSAIGEFFQNLFAAGGRDARRIKTAGKAAHQARSAEKKRLEVAKAAQQMTENRLLKLKYALSKADTQEDRDAIQAKINELRPVLRAKRAAVRDAGKTAFDTSFEASRGGGGGVAATFPLTGSPILAVGMKDREAGGTVSGNQVLLVQKFLNQFTSTKVVEDGNYGKNTAKSVSNFQGGADVHVDGKVGPATVAVMKAMQPAWRPGALTYAIPTGVKTTRTASSSGNSADYARRLRLAQAKARAKAAAESV